MEWYYALIEFYLSLIAYYILHMIFVIASDFVDAFNIPPLNIGIYVDKLAAIRALLMVLADIIEWLITQEWLHDPGAYKKLTDPGARRIGSILSFIAMLGCRSYYLWIIDKKNNKSLSVFVVLCIEGFWFGVFQMSFFAIGPEYNAITSLGIHTMGNFIFFFQLILEHYAKKYPKINPLLRVRVHGWICVINSVIVLGFWIYLCHDYVQGQDSVKPKDVKTKVEALKDALNQAQIGLDKATTPADVFKQLGEKMKNVKDVQLKELAQVIDPNFSNNPTVTPETSGTNVTVSGSGASGEYTHKVKLSITGCSGGTESEKFNDLVEALKEKLESQPSLDANGLQSALNGVTTQILQLAQSIDSGNFTSGDPEVQIRGTKVTVTIKGGSSGSGNDSKSVTVSSGGSNVEVEFEVKNASTDKAKEIANALALAMVHDDVVGAVKKKGYSIALKDGTATVEVKVTGAQSKSHAKRIAKLIAKAFEEVKEVTVTGGGTIGPTKLKLSVQRGDFSKYNVLSPLLLFPVGAFAEDFSVPGILPFAFLDPEKANIVNYLTPLFFMSGAFVIVLLNDVFSESGFAIELGGKANLDWWFKEWSEGEAHGWHSVWSLNIPKYIAFLICMFGIHGIFPKLRCIVQCRWRVMLLTIFVIIPRAILEVAGYVGVANFAIAQGETGDYDGFKFIVVHDMLAMFCRFFYGKLAVGYNWTNVSIYI